MAQCEYWRSTLVKQITGKVSEIQNGSLGEYKIRELNDSINELLKEKLKWEARITDLGGRDYASERIASSVADGGVSILGADGYKYFGAAKNLPKVRELLQKDVQVAPPKQSLRELSKNIDAHYLGLTSVNDGTETARELAELEASEARAEEALRSEQAAIDLQSKFLTKKRRRIELL